MTRRSLGLALAFVLSAGLGSAGAQGWRGWLDRLSGPDPFDGVGVSAEFLCYGEKELRATGGRPEAQGALATTSGGEPFFDFKCSRAARGAWRVVIGVELGWYEADDSGDLEFDASDFGAVPGSWSEGGEVLPGWQIVFDFTELIGR